MRALDFPSLADAPEGTPAPYDVGLHLDLGDNNLTIDSFIELMHDLPLDKIEGLNMTNNKIRDPSFMFDLFPKLKVLKLDSMKIEIGNVVGDTKNLAIEGSHNNPSAPPPPKAIRSSVPVSKLIQAYSNLQELSLANCHLSDKGLEKFVTSFETQNPHSTGYIPGSASSGGNRSPSEPYLNLNFLHGLEKLDFSYNSFRDVNVMEKFGWVLRKAKSLKEISLKHCHVGESLKYLAKGIMEGPPNLRSDLSMGGPLPGRYHGGISREISGLGGGGNSDGFVARQLSQNIMRKLMDGLKDCGIVSWDLSKNNLNTESLREFSRYLNRKFNSQQKNLNNEQENAPTDNGLETLKIRDTTLHSEKDSYLGHCLLRIRKAPSFLLDLSNCKITGCERDKMAFQSSSISKMAQRNESKMSITVSGNVISYPDGRTGNSTQRPGGQGSPVSDCARTGSGYALPGSSSSQRRSNSPRYSPTSSPASEGSIASPKTADRKVVDLSDGKPGSSTLKQAVNSGEKNSRGDKQVQHCGTLASLRMGKMKKPTKDEKPNVVPPTVSFLGCLQYLLETDQDASIIVNNLTYYQGSTSEVRKGVLPDRFLMKMILNPGKVSTNGNKGGKIGGSNPTSGFDPTSGKDRSANGGHYGYYHSSGGMFSSAGSNPGIPQSGYASANPTSVSSRQTSTQNSRIFSHRQHPAPLILLDSTYKYVKTIAQSVLNGNRHGDRSSDRLGSQASASDLRVSRPVRKSTVPRIASLIDLSETVLGDEGFYKLADIVEQTHEIIASQSLNMSHSTVGLQKLILQNCHLTFECCDILGKLMCTYMKNMNYLDVSDNKHIRDRGAVTFSTHLKKFIHKLKAELYRVARTVAGAGQDGQGGGGRQINLQQPGNSVRNTYSRRETAQTQDLSGKEQMDAQQFRKHIRDRKLHIYFAGCNLSIAGVSSLWGAGDPCNAFVRGPSGVNLSVSEYLDVSRNCDEIVLKVLAPTTGNRNIGWRRINIGRVNSPIDYFHLREYCMRRGLMDCPLLNPYAGAGMNSPQMNSPVMSPCVGDVSVCPSPEGGVGPRMSTMSTTEVGGMVGGGGMSMSPRARRYHPKPSFDNSPRSAGRSFSINNPENFATKAAIVTVNGKSNISASTVAVKMRSMLKNPRSGDNGKNQFIEGGMAGLSPTSSPPGGMLQARGLLNTSINSSMSNFVGNRMSTAGGVHLGLRNAAKNQSHLGKDKSTREAIMNALTAQDEKRGHVAMHLAENQRLPVGVLEPGFEAGTMSSVGGFKKSCVGLGARFSAASTYGGSGEGIPEAQHQMHQEYPNSRDYENILAYEAKYAVRQILGMSAPATRKSSQKSSLAGSPRGSPKMSPNLSKNTVRSNQSRIGLHSQAASLMRSTSRGSKETENAANAGGEGRGSGARQKKMPSAKTVFRHLAKDSGKSNVKDFLNNPSAVNDFLDTFTTHKGKKGKGNSSTLGVLSGVPNIPTDIFDEGEITQTNLLAYQMLALDGCVHPIYLANFRRGILNGVYTHDHVSEEYPYKNETSRMYIPSSSSRGAISSSSRAGGGGGGNPVLNLGTTSIRAMTQSAEGALVQSTKSNMGLSANTYLEFIHSQNIDEIDLSYSIDLVREWGVLARCLGKLGYLWSNPNLKRIRINARGNNLSQFTFQDAEKSRFGFEKNKKGKDSKDTKKPTIVNPHLPMATERRASLKTGSKVDPFAPPSRSTRMTGSTRIMGSTLILDRGAAKSNKLGMGKISTDKNNDTSAQMSTRSGPWGPQNLYSASTPGSNTGDAIVLKRGDGRGKEGKRFSVAEQIDAEHAPKTVINLDQQYDPKHFSGGVFGNYFSAADKADKNQKDGKALWGEVSKVMSQRHAFKKASQDGSGVPHRFFWLEPSLDFIDLEDEGLDAKDVLRTLRQAQRVTIQNCRLNPSTSSFITSFCGIRGKFENIVELELSKCKLTDKGCKSLSDVLTYGVKRIILDQNQIGAHGVVHFLDRIEEMARLKGILKNINSGVDHDNQSKISIPKQNDFNSVLANIISGQLDQDPQGPLSLANRDKGFSKEASRTPAAITKIKSDLTAAIENDRPYLSFMKNQIAHPMGELLRKFVDEYELPDDVFMHTTKKSGIDLTEDKNLATLNGIPPTARMRLNLSGNKLSFGETVRMVDALCRKPQIFAEVNLVHCLQKQSEQENPSLRGILYTLHNDFGVRVRI